MKNKNKNKNTPLVKQYCNIKNKYPDYIILFQVGDFYEMLGKDAIKCSNILNIILTKRSNGVSSSIDLAGFPCHSLKNYLPKLIKAGLRIAICNQLEESNKLEFLKKKKKLVKRGVVELITPGLILDDQILESKSNNFLASFFLKRKKAGVSFLDISTGDFFLEEGNINYIIQIIKKFNPSEILYRKKDKNKIDKIFNKNYYIYPLDNWFFKKKFSYEKLLRHFKKKSLKCFGIENMELGIISAGVILNHLSEIEHINYLSNIFSIKRIEKENFLWMDNYTFKNLEIFTPFSKEGIALIDVLDKTVSPMGGRLLKKWMNFPIKNIKIIKKRYKIISKFLHKKKLISFLSKEIKKICDIKRIVSQITSGKILPIKIKNLLQSLNSCILIKKKLNSYNSETFKKITNKINSCESLIKNINKNFSFEEKNNLNVIKTGVSKKLDNLRILLKKQEKKLMKGFTFEKNNNGFNNIPISYNNIIGYYIEIKKSKIKNKIPSHWIIKQTLSNCKRYITEKIKGYEIKIFNFKDEIINIENNIFKKIVNTILKYTNILHKNSKYISYIDVLLSFTICSIEHNYIQPKLNNSFNISIKNGRHPVIEKSLFFKNSYISNNIKLDIKNKQIIIITGPNMSGKSSILRQIALIVFMAQIGCYIPASKAKIGFLDKIFSRIGAHDNISLGESTFMVEMNETASILNNISNRSLIILDEIGRGTSHSDGIALSWSIIEYLHQHHCNPKVVISTHYYELSKMSLFYKKIKNYTLLVKKKKKKIFFMRKFIPGKNKESFGIYIAKKSGIPKKIIKKAIKIKKKMKYISFFKKK